tara:strand:- start:621 stop:1181 length:561 start_codon:yes stop_codon:yes gene_type:complete
VKKFFLLIIIYFTFSTSFADNSISNLNNYFFIGKMDSYDNAFTLFFKTRKKSILARGENSNYITDFPQDLYIYIHETKKEFPLISYEWFPRKAKKILGDYYYPVFPDDFAYYLLGDNNTLILVSASKNLNQNLEFNIKKKELKSYRKKGKLDFIISSYAKTCGYSNLESNFTCNLYKPLISNNLVN